MPRRLAALLVFVIGLAPFTAAAAELTTNAEGLFTQPWFKASTGDLRQDLKQAQAEGKILAVLWEQKGCGYCRMMHSVNFQVEEHVAYYKDKFHVVQMNLWGEHDVIDMDGSKMAQADMASKYRVTGTPMTLFFKPDGEVAFLLPGYADPPIFKDVFVYVETRGYETATIREWFKQRNSGG